MIKNKESCFKFVSFFALVFFIFYSQSFAVPASGVLSSMNTPSQNGNAIYGTQGSVTYNLSVLGSGTFNVNWTVYNLPDGVTGYFSATTTLGANFWTTQLTLVNSNIAPDPGNYNFVVQATREGTSNYIFKNPNYKVDKKPINANINVNDKEYDALTNADSNCFINDIVGSDDLTCTTGIAQFVDANAGLEKDVMATNTILGGEDSNKYDLTTDVATGKGNILPKDQFVTLSIATPTNATYGDPDIPLSSLVLLATSTSGIPPIFYAGGSCVLNEDKTVLKYIRGGSLPCEIVAYVRGDNNISGAKSFNFINRESKAKWNVSRKTQEILVESDVSSVATYGDDDLLIPQAISGSGLNVTISVSGACEMSGTDKVSYTKGDSHCNIIYRQAGDNKFLPAKTIIKKIYVKKKNQAHIFNVLQKKYLLTLKSVALSSTSDTELPFQYRVSTPTTCQIDKETLLFLSKGACIIYGRQLGDSKYNISKETKQIITIN